MLGGRYALTERIASGGMAAVWRASDTVLDRTVAVKLLHDHLAADEDFRERFRREAIAAAKLTHPNVVGLYDTGTDGDRVYLVMELVDGATLKDVMNDLGALETGQAASIGEKVARALDYAHERGLVHRDVKPANILIGDDGSVKVADFGIAKAEEAEGDLTKTGMVLGTAAYVAPEQITGSTTIDGRADQYALGCMLYEALTGRQPFKGDSAVATAAKRLHDDPMPLRSIRPDIPKGLDAIVVRALGREPDDRFASSGELADALAAFADSDTIQTAALATGNTSRPGPPRRVVRAPDPEATGAMPRPSAPPRPAAVPLPPPERPEPFLRSEGRWLALVLGLLLLVGVAIGVGLANGMFDTETGSPDDSAQPTPDPATDAAEPLEITALAAFDPQGDDVENDESLPALVDGGEETTWRTDTYNTAEFGGLKEGVGFLLDLGAPATVAGVDLTTTTPGVSYEIRVADEAIADIEGWPQPSATVDDADRSESVTFDEPVEGRFVLVWLVAPLPDSGGFRAEFAEAVVRGAAP